MKRNSISIVASLYLLFAFACSPSDAEKKHHEQHENNVEHEHHNSDEHAMEMPVRDAEQTKAVLEHHLKSFGENNIEELMADYAEDAVLITPDATLKGAEQIKGFFTELVKAFPTEGTEFTMAKMEIDNEFAYIVWSATTPVLEVPMGSDTFVIEDKKIVKQTFAGVINPIEAATEEEG